MILNTDIILTHPMWERADTELRSVKKIFRRLVDIYVVACAIGIKDDKSITEFDPAEESRTIGRNTYSTLQNQDLNEILSFLLQNALLTSKTINYDIDERVRLAFDPDYTVAKLSAASFLNGFANYGIQKIFDNVDSSGSPVVTAEKIHNFLRSLEMPNYGDIIEEITLEIVNE